MSFCVLACVILYFTPCCSAYSPRFLRCFSLADFYDDSDEPWSPELAISYISSGHFVPLTLLTSLKSEMCREWPTFGNIFVALAFLALLICFSLILTVCTGFFKRNCSEYYFCTCYYRSFRCCMPLIVYMLSRDIAFGPPMTAADADCFMRFVDVAC